MVTAQSRYYEISLSFDRLYSKLQNKDTLLVVDDHCQCVEIMTKLPG